MLIFSALICVTSLALQSPLSFNIYNQSKAINLTSPIYFIHGGKWHVAPDQEISANTVMRTCLELDSEQDTQGGALVYRVQKKHAEPDKLIQDESKHIQLLVVWSYEHEYLDVRTMLVEHDEEFAWDEDKLWRLYQKCWEPLIAWVNPLINNWLLDDATMLGTAVRGMDVGCGLDIFISEKSIDEYFICRKLKALFQEKDNYIMSELEDLIQDVYKDDVTIREVEDLVQARYEYEYKYVLRPLWIDTER
jgi:hypothetical protein